MSEILLAIALFVATLVAVVILSLPSRYAEKPAARQSGEDASSNRPEVTVQVLVLGDIGRSPRMQYHAMSIAKHGGRVTLIGYQDSPLHPELVKNDRVKVTALPVPPPLLRNSSLPFVLVAPLKVVHQFTSLLTVLLYTTPASRLLLVQNPPSIPVLLIAYLAALLRNTHLIVDWHNYGYTILSNKLPATHPLVRISRVYEQTLARWAPIANFTVTLAMAKQMKNEPWGVRSPIITLHDRPAEIFQPIASQSKRKQYLRNLAETKKEADKILKGEIRLIVSSTSWTPDEDFSLLLDALVSYASIPTGLPILAIITGKGPDKQKYLDRIEQLGVQGKLGNVEIKTAWLSMSDYATLLACADLGVCLHMSSSGVDLPMKVVDMFGAGLPVAGYAGYESWGELVKEGINGKGFERAEELKDILLALLGKDTSQLELLKRGAVEEGRRRWDDEWNEVAGGVLGLVN